MASNTPDIEKTRYLLMLEFALSLSEATGLKTLKADVIPKLKYIMDFNRCGLALLNEEKSSYRLLTLLETREEMPRTGKERIALDNGIYGKVILDGEPSVFRGLSQESPKGIAVADPSMEGGSLNSVMCLALQASGRIFGSIAFGTNETLGYGRADIYMASTIAAHLSLAIDRWKMVQDLATVSEKVQELNEELEESVERRTAELTEEMKARQQAQEALSRYAKRLLIVQEIDRGILAASSPHAISEAAIRHIRQLVPCARASVTVFDFEADESIVTALDVEGETKFVLGARLSLKRFGGIDALRRGSIHRVEDASTMPSTPYFDALRADGLRSSISVPLIAQGELIGTLNLASAQPKGFVAEHLNIAREVADSVAIAIHQATLHEQIERHAVELEDRVAERTAELEAFSYTVSHDLRGPLRVIDGFSRALIEDHSEQLDAEGQRLLNVVHTNCLRMQQLIDDLLAFAHLRRQQIALTEIDMTELAKAAFEEVKATQQNVEATFEALPAARGDQAMIRQVWVNLLSNAVKFTRTRQTPCIHVGYTAERGANIYYVRDNGVGFDARYADKLFGVFERVHPSDDFEGTGVGLAIVQRIIHRHGGRAWAEGQVNDGATLYFTLAQKSSRLAAAEQSS